MPKSKLPHALQIICGRQLLIAGGQSNRIFDNQHLLDATEIFRKLNVHKKVKQSVSNSKIYNTQGYLTNTFCCLGVFHQAGLPPGYVLFLLVLHDSCLDTRRVALTTSGSEQQHEEWRLLLMNTPVWSRFWGIA